MEQTAYTILFIDDHSSSYLPSLEPAAKVAGFELYATDNILDGLTFLNDYADTVNAVILDLSFPKGEMQGTEALQKIKKKHPHIPVIMLTDSDSASDIDRVVDCMKKGAYNYVGKRTLNPVYLFQVVAAAVQQQQLQLRLISKNTPVEKKQHFYTVSTPYNYGRYKQSSCFGFELVSVNKPGNEYEAAQLNKAVLGWHENLLKSISIIYRDEVQLNLKYISNANKIKCCIIFTVFAVDEQALELIVNNLQHDISVFFSASKIDNTHPYLFEEIQDAKFLNNANEYSPQYKYNVFYRKPLKVNTAKAIGFSSPVIKADEESNAYTPDELFPFPAKIDFDNELFRALLNQKKYVEIDIQLMPKQLLKEEIDLVRQVIKNTSTLDANTLTNEELRYFTSHLQKFVASTNDKFMVSVVLKRSGSNWEQHLKTGILNYFFGSYAETGYQLRKPDSLFRFCTSDKGVPNQLPFFYSIHDAIQVFRLPVPGLSELPGIQEQSHIFHSIPDNLPEDGILIGEKNGVTGKQDIKITKDSLARHLYTMGQTGTGKSTLLKTMIADCLKKNEGFAVIDPHGDLFDEVLKMIPKSKQKKLSIINTTDPANSAKHNPIGYDENNPQSKSLVINELIRVFGTLYDMKTAGGPMFELYLKNGLLLLLDEKVQAKHGNGTLADFVELFFNETFRSGLLEICENKKVSDFFKVAMKNTGDWSFNNFATYITSKLTRFTEDYYLTPIISNKKGNINFRKLIDEGNILLVKMDKGLIGSDNVSLLGQMIVSSLVMAAMSRGSINKDERKPFYLFIDEFQNFIKGDVGSALSEVRKYGLSLTLANQTLGQLEKDTVEALLGNVGSLVFFRPGINDYEKIRHYIEPEFKREDVLKLPNFNCIARLMIDNVPSDPFVFQTKV